MKAVLSLAILVLILITARSSHAVTNPYGLITDKELEVSDIAINTLWDTAERQVFVGFDEVEIHYRIFKNPNTIGAIVVSSGRTESFIKYKELVYTLFTAGYSVYIHDHRGQGFSGRMVESDSQMGHVWEFENYIKDLKSFYDLKVAPNRHDNLFLLGHSMGGAIATLYIEKYQDDFKAAALSSPMHQPATGTLGGVACSGASFTTTVRDYFISMFGWEPRYAVGQGPYENINFSPDTETMMTHSEARFRAVQQLYDANDEIKIGGVSSHWLANACDASITLLKNADSVRIPVLVLQAQNDIAVTPEGQDRFCELLQLAGKSMCKSGKPIVIPGAFHEILIESDEYRIPAITEILSFFEEQST